MPFKSEKQKRYLFANEPKIAERWMKEEKGKFGKSPKGEQNRNNPGRVSFEERPIRPTTKEKPTGKLPEIMTGDYKATPGPPSKGKKKPKGAPNYQELARKRVTRKI